LLSRVSRTALEVVAGVRPSRGVNDAMAAVIATDGDADEATRLLDEATEVRQRSGVSLDVEDRAVRERAMTAIRRVRGALPKNAIGG